MEFKVESTQKKNGQNIITEYTVNNIIIAQNEKYKDYITKYNIPKLVTFSKLIWDNEGLIKLLNKELKFSNTKITGIYTKPKFLKQLNKNIKNIELDITFI